MTSTPTESKGRREVRFSDKRSVLRDYSRPFRISTELSLLWAKLLALVRDRVEINALVSSLSPGHLSAACSVSHTCLLPKYNSTFLGLFNLNLNDTSVLFNLILIPSSDYENQTPFQNKHGRSSKDEFKFTDHSNLVVVKKKSNPQTRKEKQTGIISHLLGGPAKKLISAR